MPSLVRMAFLRVECYTSEIPLEQCTEFCCPFGSWYVVGCHVFFEAGDLLQLQCPHGGGGKSRWVVRVDNSDRTGAQCQECPC